MVWAIIALALVTVAVGVFFLRHFVRAGPDSALVIRRASNPADCRVVRRGASTFMWVLSEKSERLTLEVLSAVARVTDASGREVEVSIGVQVRDDEASILRASERFRGERADEIRRFAVETVGRAVHGGPGAEKAVEAELGGAGLKLVSCELKRAPM